MEFSLLADIASIVLELEPGLLELPCTIGPLATCPSVGALPSLSLVSAARRLEKYIYKVNPILDGLFSFISSQVM